jgi:hypothetical protein
MTCISTVGSGLLAIFLHTPHLKRLGYRHDMANTNTDTYQAFVAPQGNYGYWNCDKQNAQCAKASE